MKDRLELVSLHGEEIKPYLEDLARLRIGVFREYPYLYDGTEDYEKEYLQVYINSSSSLIVLARDQQGTIVGATTALPLADADRGFQKPFVGSTMLPETVYYFGESVLLPEWRGHGVGHLFFDAREEYAVKLGYGITTFCAVVRTVSHPLKPQDYRLHDKFWMARGYSPEAGLCCQFSWKDIDQSIKTEKMMQFWIKRLS